MRYLIIENSNVNWIDASSIMQFDFNNAFNTSIDQTFNKFKFDFVLREFIILLIDEFMTKSIVNRLMYRKKNVTKFSIQRFLLIKINLFFK